MGQKRTQHFLEWSSQTVGDCEITNNESGDKLLLQISLTANNKMLISTKSVHLHEMFVCTVFTILYYLNVMLYSTE